MFRVFFFIVVCCFPSVALAQKQVQKSIDAQSIDFIQVDAGQCFEVVLTTEDTNTIAVKAQLEGEYSAGIDVNFRQDGSTLFVSTEFGTTFNLPNDKLSAHKVVSVSLHITVPNYKKVVVQGETTHVTAQGDYEYLGVVLSDGSCELRQVTSAASVKTHSGNISVVASDGEVTASSSYGSIDSAPFPSSTNTYKLSTVTGRIQLSKPE